MRRRRVSRTSTTPTRMRTIPLRESHHGPILSASSIPAPRSFAPRATPKFPRNVPPAFLICAGSGDQQHAIWANDYFTAMLAARVPNIEMHIYAQGFHPGSGSTGGLTDRHGTPMGTWHLRFIEWMRDLGFLQKPGVETKAAQDIALYPKQPQRGGRRTGPDLRAVPPAPPAPVKPNDLPR